MSAYGITAHDKIGVRQVRQVALWQKVVFNNTAGSRSGFIDVGQEKRNVHLRTLIVSFNQVLEGSIHLDGVLQTKGV